MFQNHKLYNTIEEKILKFRTLISSLSSFFKKNYLNSEGQTLSSSQLQQLYNPEQQYQPVVKVRCGVYFPYRSKSLKPYEPFEPSESHPSDPLPCNTMNHSTLSTQSSSEMLEETSSFSPIKVNKHFCQQCHEDTLSHLQFCPNCDTTK